MNYKSSFYLSNVVFLYILFLLVSCTTKRLATTPDVVLIPLNNSSKQGGNYEVRVNYIGLINCNYEFEVYIRNNSKDSVFVNPDLFRYSFISENNEKNKHIIYSISPEEKIKQLKIQEDSLKNLIPLVVLCVEIGIQRFGYGKCGIWEPLSCCLPRS